METAEPDALALSDAGEERPDFFAQPHNTEPPKTHEIAKETANSGSRNGRVARIALPLSGLPGVKLKSDFAARQMERSLVMKSPVALACVLALGLGSLGCSGSEDDTDVNLELLTWWSQDSERDAVKAVITLNNARHPNVHVRVLYADSQQAMARDINLRLADGTPPSAFQANLGGNALQWANRAQGINDRAEAWSGAFQASILERLTDQDGKILGVPVAVTRQNNVYYNKDALAEAGVDIPEGRDGLTDWLATLADKGYTHPICIGDQYNWVSAHVLFEDIVPGYVGAKYSQKFWSGQLKPNDPAFAEALDYAATLVKYVNTDFDGIDWDVGLKRVMDSADPAEQCLMTPMGDWGGAVLASDYEPDKDFVQRAWPGAESLFVLAGDAFITAQGVNDQTATLDFFDTMASEEGQVAFNIKKGAVPARTLPDARQSEFPPLARANMADLANGTALPGYKVLGSAEFPWEQLARLSHDFILLGDTEPLLAFIAKHYDELRALPPE